MLMGISAEGFTFPLGRVEKLNWVLLAALSISALLLVDRFFAGGVLVGGLIANVSFIFLKRDLTGILAGPLSIAKVRFFMKYYIRLAVLAVLLFFLVRHQLVGVFGLLVGLSTVVVSIVCTAAGVATKFYSTSKEAA